jgi:5-methylcytosine-specific restriction endonuclease McrA
MFEVYGRGIKEGFMGWTVERDGMRCCIMCNQSLPLSDFYSCSYTTKQGKPSKRRDSRCIECSKARRRADWRTNQPARLKVVKAYRAANRTAIRAQQNSRLLGDEAEKVRRMKRIYQSKRKAKSRLPGAENRAMMERVLEEARFCGGYLDAYTGEIIQEIQVDHIDPISRGGQHCYENLCVTSPFNNGSKNALPLIVWMASR